MFHHWRRKFHLRSGVPVFVSISLQTSRFQQLITLVPGASGGISINNDITRSDQNTNPMNDATGQEMIQNFINQYFQALGSNPQQVASAYRESSVMKLEGSETTGANIAQALNDKFSGCRFQLNTVDIHFLANSCSVAMVTGGLLLPGQENPLMFTRVFVLSYDGGNPFIANDVFRLNYG